MQLVGSIKTIKHTSRYITSTSILFTFVSVLFLQLDSTRDNFKSSPAIAHIEY